MNFLPIKKINKKVLSLTNIYAEYSLHIEKHNKKTKDFNLAFYAGTRLYYESWKILKKLKKIVARNNCTTLQQDEVRELVFLFKSYKRVIKKINRGKTKEHLFFKKFHDEKESKYVIYRNSIFVYLVNFISRNFLNITLPVEFDVDKFVNDANKVSLNTLLKTTDWSIYFKDNEVKEEMIKFSQHLFSTNWWNHSKYYRNIFVHRISLDTYYSKNYKNMNLRIKSYLPTLCYLGLKYYLYNLLNESTLLETNKEKNKFSNFFNKLKNNKKINKN